MEDWQTDLLERLLKSGWNDLHCVDTNSRTSGDQDYHSRDYVYEQGGKYFKQTFHHDNVGSGWGGFHDEEYWDSPEEITKEEFETLKAGKARIDTPENAKNLEKLKQQREQARRKAEAERVAEEARKPSCPDCGKKMVSRKNKKTKEEFWGCPNYPKCRGTREM